MSSDNSNILFVTVGSIKVRVVKDVITNQQVDVIVNSSNSSLDLKKGRASKALLGAAGDVIQTECEKYPNGIQDGEIAITSGGQLSCKAIYHGALSKFSGPQDEQTLTNLIKACLDQANTDKFQTMAFPALGTGFLSYPVSTVARITLDCIHNCSATSLKEVLVVIFTTEDDSFKTFLAEAKKYIPKARSPGKKLQAPTTSNSCKIGPMTVEVVVTTLSSVKADVIVCSGPKDLKLTNGSLSKSLLEGAGNGLQEELDSSYPNGIDFGECAISKGYNLPCKSVYHGTLPKWGSSTPDPSYILKKFMVECLKEANNHSVKSIAFPTLGLGALHFPAHQSAKLMAQGLREFNNSHRRITIGISKVIIVVYSEMKDSGKIQTTFLNELTDQSAPSVKKSVFSGKIDGVPVTVKVGNITIEKVDVLVNSVSTKLGLTSGSAGAISAAAGPGLASELTTSNPNGLKYGELVVTAGHDIANVKEIYHGALLPWYSKRAGGTKPPDDILEEFILECLQKANTNGHKSIAFPALGTGYLKFPTDVASACMVAAFSKFCRETKNKSVSELRVVLYEGADNLKQLEKAFQDEFSQLSAETTDTSGSDDVKKKSSKPHHIHLRRRVPAAPPQRGTKAYLEWKYREDARTPPYWSKFTCKKKLKDWNLQVQSGAAHMEKVDQKTHQCIEAAFKSSMGNAQIVSIHRIENVELFLKYTDECQRLFRKAIVEGELLPLHKVSGSTGPAKTMQHLDQTMQVHTHPEINEYYFFHGTKPDNVPVITGQGLDNRLAYAGLLGTGVYGAEDAVKSNGYTGVDTNGCRPMFLMRMCLGDIYITNISSSGIRRPPCKKCGLQVCTSHQELFDSVVANFLAREFVVYDRSQSYPEYLIWYK